MFLKELTKNKDITVTYYENGSLHTCKGHVCNLDVQNQTLYLKDKQQKSIFIRLSGIRKIH